MDNLTKCSICKEKLFKPKILPCFHHACESCLYVLVSKGHDLKCGTCDLPFYLSICDIEKLPENNWLDRVIDRDVGNGLCELCNQKESTKLCTNCGQFCCLNCSEIHLKFKISRDHVILDRFPPNLNSISLCRCHQVPLTQFCVTCNEPLCDIAVEAHQDHNLQEIGQFSNKKKEEVSKYLTEAKEKIASINEVSNSLGNLIEESCLKSEIKINQYFDKTQEIIQSKKREYLHHLSEIKESRSKILKTHSEGLKRVINSVQDGCDFVQNIINQASDLEVIQLYHTASILLSRVHHICPTPLYSTDVCFEAPESKSLEQLQKSLGRLKLTWTDPQQCTFEYSPLNGSIDRVSVFKVFAVNQSGMRIFTHGDPFCMIATSPDKSKTFYEMKDHRNGVYSVIFRPRQQGMYLIHFELFGNRLPRTIQYTVNSIRDYKSISVPKIIIGGEEGTSNGQFNNPYGIAVSADGTIAVADNRNGRIQLLNCNGEFIKSFGKKGSSESELNNPWGVCVDKKGNIIVGDCSNHRIQSFNIDGTHQLTVGKFGKGEGKFDCPAYLAQDKNGCYYVSDDQDIVQVFDENWNYIRQFGSQGTNEGQFRYPEGIAIDSNNRIIVVDYGNHRVQVFDNNGTYLFSIGQSGKLNSQFDSPWSVAVDAWDNIIVADTNNNRIQIFDKNGQFIHLIGGLNRPYGVATDEVGQIYVCDTANHSVKIF